MRFLTVFCFLPSSDSEHFLFFYLVVSFLYCSENIVVKHMGVYQSGRFLDVPSKKCEKFCSGERQLHLDMYSKNLTVCKLVSFK